MGKIRYDSKLLHAKPVIGILNSQRYPVNNGHQTGLPFAPFLIYLSQFYLKFGQKLGLNIPFFSIMITI